MSQEYLQELPQFVSRAEGGDDGCSPSQRLALAFPHTQQVARQGEAGQKGHEGESQGGEAEGWSLASLAGALCPLPRTLLGGRKRSRILPVQPGRSEAGDRVHELSRLCQVSALPLPLRGRKLHRLGFPIFCITAFLHRRGHLHL